MQSLKVWFKKNILYVLSFMIPVLIMLVIFMLRRIYPFGDESFLHSDMYHQYMPFFSEFLHKLREGGSLFYSWNVGMGENFLALYVYYLASPFNWLALLFPHGLLMEFMSYLIIIKIGLCSLTFAIYLRHHFFVGSPAPLSSPLPICPDKDQPCSHAPGQHPAILFFSCFYALSGFLAAYNWNIMWLDCIFLAPLVILGLEKLVLEKKSRLYCITLALSILSNYYISIMLCIFLVLYFIVLLCTRKDAYQAIGRFILYSLLAGGMAAVLLFPEMCALYFTDFSDPNFPKKITSYFSVFDMLARHCAGVATEQGLDHWPNIYCGVAVLFLLPLYIMNRKISLREKIGRVALLGFMLVSFSTNLLNFLWHGLNYPDSLPARQSFLYIFLLLTLCFEAVIKIEGNRVSELVRCFCGSVVFVLLCEKLISNKDMFPFGVFWGTLLLLAVYASLLYYYRKYTVEALDPEYGLQEQSASVSPLPESGLPGQPASAGLLPESGPRNSRRGKALQTLALITAVTVILESGINMFTTSVSTTSRSKYLSGHESYRILTQRIREKDDDFYRIEKFSRVTKNDGTMIGYPTASVFSSTANSHVGDFYQKLGMSHSKVFYCFEGATPFSSALLGVRYMYARNAEKESSLYRLVDQEDDVYLYECTYSLPIGYIVPNREDTGEFTLEDEEIADQPESIRPESGNAEETGLLDDLLGASEQGAQIVLEESFQADARTPLERQNSLAASLGASDVLFQSVPVEINNNLSTFTAPEDGYYYAFTNSNDVSSATAHMNGETKEFKKLRYDYIMDLGRQEAGTTVSLEADSDKPMFLSVYRLNEPVLAQVIDVLQEQPFVVDSHSDTHAEGHITVTKPGSLILSIPYESGWSLSVDGVPTEPALFADTMISIPLDTGEHTISLRYYPAGLNAGIAVSLLSLAVFLGILFRERKRQAAVKTAEEKSASAQTD